VIIVAVVVAVITIAVVFIHARTLPRHILQAGKQVTMACA